MAEYQNLFTQVQVRHAPDPGVGIADSENRIPDSGFSYWLGKIGDSQIGPVYLGWLGLLAILTGGLSIFLMGMVMLSSVGWDPVQFVRLLPWLSVEPPSPEWGLRIPPLNEGGWWLWCGFLLTVSIFCGGRGCIAGPAPSEWEPTWRGPSPRPSGSIWCWASSARS
jgi:photosynthetic reaction center M subunit